MPPLRLRKLNAESGSTRETMSLVAHWKGRHDGGACRPVAETARAVCSEQRHQAHRGPHAKGAGVATAGCGRGLAALRGNARMCLLCEKQPERRGVGRRRADQLRSCAFDHVNFARVRQNGGQVTSRYALRGHVYAVGSLQAVAMAPNSRTWSELRERTWSSRRHNTSQLHTHLLVLQQGQATSRLSTCDFCGLHV